jgi:hypothetical protein
MIVAQAVRLSHSIMTFAALQTQLYCVEIRLRAYKVRGSVARSLMTTLEPLTMPPESLHQALKTLLDSHKVLYEQILHHTDGVTPRPPSPVVSGRQAVAEDVISLANSVDGTVSSMSRSVTPPIETRSKSDADQFVTAPRNAKFFFEDHHIQVMVRASRTTMRLAVLTNVPVRSRESCSKYTDISSSMNRTRPDV